MKTCRQTAAGFTVIELMVVVAVLGILSSIAVPSFKSLIQSQRVKNASFELYSNLVYARSEAIKRNDNVIFNIVNDGGGSIGWNITVGVQELRTQATISGVVFTLNPSGTTSLTFTSTGRVTSSPTFQIDASSTATSNVRCVKVGLSGLPQSNKGACS